MSDIDPVETRIQIANNQFLAAMSADSADALGGSLNYLLGQLGEDFTNFGRSSGSSNPSLPGTNGVATTLAGTTCTFDTTGRPVLLFLVGSGNTTPEIASTVINTFIYLRRNGVVVAKWTLGSDGQARVGLGFLDTGASAGSNTWLLQYSAPTLAAGVFVATHLCLVGFQI